MKISNLFFVAVLGFLTLPARADYVTVPLPESQMDFRDAYVEPKPPLIFEANASTWVPNQFSDNSYLSNTTDFQSVSFPKISLNAWRANWRTDYLQITPKYGLSFSQLQRSGYLMGSTGSRQINQTLNLYSGRVGVEVSPTSFFGLEDTVKPYFGVAYLPTYGLSAETAFNNGTNKFYNIFEASAGITWNIPYFASLINADSVAIEVGAEATQSVFGSSVSGLGFIAGTRIGI